MYAYSQVDVQTRRKLEELLKTWREPVPNSISSTPVFPFASTQPIVDTLNRYRSSAAPSSSRPQSAVQRVYHPMPYQSAPTPAQPLAAFNSTPHQNDSFQMNQTNGMYATQAMAPSQVRLKGGLRETLTANVFKYHGVSPPQFSSQINPNPITFMPQQSTPQPSPPFASGQFIQPPSLELATGPGAVDLKKLHEDIDDLTTDAKIDCATHPMDQNAMMKLTSLQKLREMLDSGSVAGKDLIDIRDSILQQKAKRLAASRPMPQGIASPYNQNVPHTESSQQYLHPNPTPQPATTGGLSFLGTTNLAELLRATAPSDRAATPILHPGVSTPPVSISQPIASSELSLLAQLRASGLLAATLNPPHAFAPKTLDGTLTPILRVSSIKFSSAAIRGQQPTLFATFLSTRPNQCTTCGRRFTSDNAGKEQKARHLDWHFRTRTRMLEAESRAQNRSWYVDEREWIASREYDDDQGPGDQQSIAVEGTSKMETTRSIEDYVRVPTDPAVRGAPCPIDLEPFRSEWNEELQDFIWKDAMRIGGRYYHASCYRDYMKGRDTDRGLRATDAERIATPDSILGKRKADVGSALLETKRFIRADNRQAINDMTHKLKIEAT